VVDDGEKVEGMGRKGAWLFGRLLERRREEWIDDGMGRLI